MTHGEHKCALWFCGRSSYALGFCMTHYQNLRRHGDVVAPSEVDQRALRDMCDDLSTAALRAIDVVMARGGSCPACGASMMGYHEQGCPIDNLFMLASRVKASQGAETIGAEQG